MTTTHVIVYVGLFVAIFGAFLIGRSLDKQHSNGHVTWKTGCIGQKTFIQSVVLGVVAGPVVYLIKGGKEELWFCVLAMMAAPFIVDLLRPTVTVSSTAQASPQFAQFTNKLNTAHLLAIVLAVFIIGAWVGVTVFGSNISLPTSHESKNGVCK